MNNCCCRYFWFSFFLDYINLVIYIERCLMKKRWRSNENWQYICTNYYVYGMARDFIDERNVWVLPLWSQRSEAKRRSRVRISLTYVYHFSCFSLIFFFSFFLFSLFLTLKHLKPSLHIRFLHLRHHQVLLVVFTQLRISIISCS